MTSASTSISDNFTAICVDCPVGRFSNIPSTELSDDLEACKSCLPGFKKPDAEKKCMNCQQGYERNDYQADIDMNLYDDLDTKPVIKNFEEKNGATCMKDEKMYGVTHELTVSNVAGENGEKINECQNPKG